MVSFHPAPGEKILLDEDCSEDKLRSGILVLTDHRLVFQRTQGRIATLSKKETEVALDIPLDKISSVTSEGFLVKKSGGSSIWRPIFTSLVCLIMASGSAR